MVPREESVVFSILPNSIAELPEIYMVGASSDEKCAFRAIAIASGLLDMNHRGTKRHVGDFSSKCAQNGRPLSVIVSLGRNYDFTSS